METTKENRQESPAFDPILSRLPQRDPFLFVDKIVSCDGHAIETEKYLSGEENFWSGHFPGLPLMPGVLLCEALFQSGGLLLKLRSEDSASSPLDKNKIGVVTKIESTRFKQMVRPKDTLRMVVEIKEEMKNIFFFTGKTYIKESSKLAVICEFACVLVDQESILPSSKIN
ncbi:MAG: beta-hydroxyacyl-ACP dehydratase [Oligoflexia bacterium]|nr:beta-hydroxyacyl-ACP dehydratase [Oligoflexia bacterium]MBF0366831.1 beta-hydroxyacyl-ACP dehydratase [Oligoflexia bacterium]